MNTIAVGSVIIFGLLIFLLATPLELTFNLEHIKKFKGQLFVRWLFGLVKFRIRIPDGAESQQDARKLKNKRTKTKKSEKHQLVVDSSKFAALLKQPAFRRRFYKFIQDLLRAAHARDLTLRARIGLGDPANTGQLWALLGPITAMTANIRAATIQIEPEFIDSIFEIHSHGKIRLVPLEFIALVIGFVLSPQSIHAWRSLR